MKTSINLQIGDRNYPLKVANEEVERLRKGAKVLNAKIKEYRQRFELDDVQDLLAMIAFDSVITEHQTSSSHTKTHLEIGEKVNSLNRLIDALKLDD